MSVKRQVGAGVDRLVSGLEYVLALALLAGILLNFANVVGRYVADATITGGDEIEIYILIAIAFLGSTAVTWRGMHLRMDVLMESLGEGFRRVMSWVELVVATIVAGFVAYQSYLYAAKVFRLGAVSDIAHVPTWIPHSAIPISLALIVVFQLIRVAIGRRGPRENAE